MKKTRTMMTAIILAFAICSSAPGAQISVDWMAPPDQTFFDVGTTVMPSGVGSGSGVSGGTGLDFAFVLDSSGSMSSTVYGKTRAQWQREAAIALVNALPSDTTSVSVIEFDSSANLVKQLLPLTSASKKSEIIDAINAVDASGGTNIGRGIDVAATELTSIRHDSTRASMMVVTSDGASDGSPGENADTAALAGIGAIHSIGLPGHDVATMQEIVDGADDIYNNGDDHGVYTDVNDLTELESIFSGTGGTLVGLDHIDLTMPDGTVLSNYATDGLGNFKAPAWKIEHGANVFKVTAYNTEGASATATLTLYGTCPVPEPSSIMLLVCGMGTLLLRQRRKK